MPRQAYVFEAESLDAPGVTRAIAVRDDQTLHDLHDALRRAFGWSAGSQYSFSIGAAELDPDAAAETTLGDVGLRIGQELEYVFEYVEDWSVRVRLIEVEAAEDEGYPLLLAGRGELPPPGVLVDEDELGAGD